MSGGERSAIPPSLPSMVAARYPGVAWEESTAVTGDLDCDGTADYAIGGRSDQGWTVAVLLGPLSSRSKASRLSFAFGGESQEALCGTDVTLETESLDYDPLETVGQPLEGFRGSDRCIGITLGSGECDAHHLYWNHVKDGLDWWRL